MNRIKKAWLALTCRLQPIEVFAASELVKAYVVTDWQYIFGAGVHRFPKSRRYYATCTQAYAQEPGRTVEEVDLVQIGGNFYFLPGSATLREIWLQPKPKRPKGKAKA